MSPTPPHLAKVVLTDKQKNLFIEALRARVKVLEAKLSMSSEHPSKPPSSDGFAEPDETTLLHATLDKMVCYQHDHKGTTLKMQLLERRQFLDVPAASFEVIRHCTRMVMSACGQRYDSALPTDESETVYDGPDVRALDMLLLREKFAPKRVPRNLSAKAMGCISSSSSPMATPTNNPNRMACCNPSRWHAEAILRFIADTVVPFSTTWTNEPWHA